MHPVPSAVETCDACGVCVFMQAFGVAESLTPRRREEDTMGHEDTNRHGQDKNKHDQTTLAAVRVAP